MGLDEACTEPGRPLKWNKRVPAHVFSTSEASRVTGKCRVAFGGLGIGHPCRSCPSRSRLVGEPGEPRLHRAEGKPFRSPFSSDRALFLRGTTTSGLGQWALGTRGKPGARRGELQRRRRYVRLQPSGFGGGWCHSGPWLLGGAGGRAAASSSECFEARGVAFCRGVRNSEEEGAWHQCMSGSSVNAQHIEAALRTAG